MKMKRSITLLLILTMVFLLSACGSSSGADKVYTLSVHQHDSSTAGIGLFLTDWTAKLEAASGGRLKFDVYHGGVLGSARDTVEMIQRGTCDIGWGLQNYFAGVFDGSLVIMNPMIGIKDAKHGSRVMWALYKNNKEIAAEYKDFHMLMVHTSLNIPISTRSVKIENIDQFIGMKFRGLTGPMMTFVQELKAAPVNVSIGELYQAVETGVAEAVLSDWQALKAFSLFEPLNYFLDEPITVTNYFLLMNKDSYNALPDDLKKLIDDNSGDAAIAIVGDYWAPFEVDCRRLVGENKGVIYQLSDAERARIKSIAEITNKKWIDEITSKGYNGQALFDECVKYVEQFK